MYEFLKNSAHIAFAEAPAFVKYDYSNKCYALTDESGAEGVYIKGKHYSIAGKRPLPQAEVIEMQTIDSAYIFMKNEKEKADTDALLIEQEYRLTLLELGGI